MRTAVTSPAALADRYEQLQQLFQSKKAEKDQYIGSRPTWTVMIFMGVADLKGDLNLEEAARDDLAEIEAIGGGGDHCLNICVQKNFGGDRLPERHHFTGQLDKTSNDRGEERTTWTPSKAGTVTVHEPAERDYRDGRALAAFISDSLLRSGHRQHDHSLLVLWGHAYDFTFGSLLGPGGGTVALNFSAIGDVLKRVQGVAEQTMDPGGVVPGLPMIDVLAFDACDIATAELTFQLKNVARFLLASQVGVPLPGFPYHRLLDRLKTPYGRLMSPAELGSYAVRRYCAAYAADSPVSLTMLNLARADELFAKTQAVSIELAMAIENPAVRDRLVRMFLRSQTELGKPFVDVADLCLSFTSELDYPGLVDKAQALGDFVAGSRPDVKAPAEDQRSWPLVIDHDRNSGELVRLNGVSLYAPNVAPPDDADRVGSVYRLLDFVKEGRWSGVVHRLAF